LFVSERRKPLSRVTVWHMIGEIAKAAGLTHLDIHPHMLRHSCGYALVNKGTDIRIIQGYLGHRAISSTVKVHDAGQPAVCEAVLGVPVCQ
jgi:type 1 fimbriae regulatory protein FimB/type 1 fimbriae regulatory protein FimE